MMVTQLETVTETWVSPNFNRLCDPLGAPESDQPKNGWL